MQEWVVVLVGQFFDGLLGEEWCKMGWMWVEVVGDLGFWCQQVILGCGYWDVDVLCYIVWDYVVEMLVDFEVVWVIDEIGFLKQGYVFCGVVC